MGRMHIAKITWGSAFANTLNFGYLLDNIIGYSSPRDGSDWVQFQSGTEDAWITGTDYVLEFDVRWIPISDTGSPVATGWDGTTGFRAFLEWARQKNQFRFFPDKNSGSFILSYLVEPIAGGVEIEDDGTRRVRMTIRNASSNYDGY